MKTPISRRLFVTRSVAVGAGSAVLGGCGGGGGLLSSAGLVPSILTTPTPTPTPAAAAPTPTPATFKWKPLRIGAGGYVTGLDIAPDGTKVCRCDSSGAYIWSDSAAQWQPLLTMASMPAGEWGREVTGISGVYEIAIAPTNSARIYVMFNQKLFRTDDRGHSFVATNVTGVHSTGGDDFRVFSTKMAVDPSNPDIVFIGAENGPLVMTPDAGATMRTVASVTPATTNNGMRVVFDPSSPVRNGATQRLYVSSEGVGVFVSNDGGASFSAIPNSPVDIQHMVCDQGGTVWATEGQSSANVRRLVAGVWAPATATSGPYKTIAVDPHDVNHIVIATAGGSIAQTFDHGVTWTGLYVAGRRVATDIPWLAWTNENYMSSGEMRFDPSATNKLYFSEGIGVWWTNPPSTFTTFDWTSQSAGIEQLVSNQLISPPGGKPIYMAWDRPIFRIDNPDTYPATHGPGNTDSIVMGWGADYAPDDPNTIVALVNWANIDRSGISTDGGVTWRAFGSMPAEITSGGKNGGAIAAGSRTNFMIVANNNGNPWYTKDGGTTWARSSVPGVPTTGETGWGWAYYFHRFVLVADKVAANTFYLYNYLAGCAGVYKSTDGGATFTRVFSGVVTDWTTFHTKLYSVPGKQGHLFLTPGPQDGPKPSTVPLMRSTDGGASWQRVSTDLNLLEVDVMGFGAAPPGKDYPAIFIVGYVSGKPGIWRSDDNAASWTNLGAFPLDVGDEITAISGDNNTYGKVYVGFGGSGGVYGLIS